MMYSLYVEMKEPKNGKKVNVHKKKVCIDGGNGRLTFRIGEIWSGVEAHCIIIIIAALIPINESALVLKVGDC